MAKGKKGKKGKKRGYRPKKKGGKRGKKGGLAQDVGAAWTGWKIVGENNLGGRPLVDIAFDKSTYTRAGMKQAGQVVKAQVTDPKTYAPVLVGAVITKYKHKPIVRIVAAPLDSVLKKYVGRGL